MLAKKKKKMKVQARDAYWNPEYKDVGADLDLLDHILDLREYDVPYYVRCCIDCNIRVGSWYQVIPWQAYTKLLLIIDENQYIKIIHK